MRKRYGILDQIERPADLRTMGYPLLYELCTELRTFILDSVSETGGHLASNLVLLIVRLTVWCMMSGISAMCIRY